MGRTLAAHAAMNVTTVVVWVYCDADTMHTYIRHRGAARDAVKLADWPGYLATIDVDFRTSVPHMVIDNRASSAPLQAQAKELVKTVLADD